MIFLVKLVATTSQKSVNYHQNKTQSWNYTVNQLVKKAVLCKSVEKPPLLSSFYSRCFSDILYAQILLNKNFIHVVESAAQYCRMQKLKCNCVTPHLVIKSCRRAQSSVNVTVCFFTHIKIKRQKVEIVWNNLAYLNYFVTWEWRHKDNWSQNTLTLKQQTFRNAVF